MKQTNQDLKLCAFGRKLIQAGLVARTWGNFSIRLDENHFLITPSGRSYDNLEAEEIVTVNLNDLSYQGTSKPSSEKELHQRIYLNYPAIRAIIHTHQPAASAVAAARIDLPVTENTFHQILGPVVPCVDYALPTTKALAIAVEKKILQGSYKALLLANHGAVCLGKDLDQAFEQAVILDQAAENYVLECFRKVSGQDNGDQKAMINYYVNQNHKGKNNGKPNR